ncbi:MAG: hypothetical protein HKN70_13330 [Gammaproteobacteria bacterium]|nr:hypothetical protein [Gammaproteobacteria bacterium]
MIVFDSMQVLSDRVLAHQKHFSGRSARALLVAVYLASAVTGTHAANVANLGEQLQTCAALADATQRLACFDGVAQAASAADYTPITPSEMVQAGSTASVSSATAAPVSTTTPDEAPDGQSCDGATGDCVSADDEDTVGSRYLRRDSIKKTREKASVYAFTLVDAKRNARGRWLFYFDNGQIWKQIDSRSAHIPDPPIEAQIKVGTFGSHKLSIEDRVRGLKIKRLK